MTNTGNCLRIRQAPDFSSPELMCLPDGTVLKSENGNQPDWQEVSYHGQVGWAMKYYLVPCQQGLPPWPNIDRWTVLPFQGNANVRQFFGDTRYARFHSSSRYLSSQGMHYGIDWNIEPEMKLVAVCSGLVVQAGYPAPFSHGPKSVVLRCGNYYVIYGPILNIVEKGNLTSVGQVIGVADYATLPYFHFEVRPVPWYLVNNTNLEKEPKDSFISSNPRRFFARSLDDYFDRQFDIVGGFAHWCTGDMEEQPDIYFGGPLRTDPCTTK